MNILALDASGPCAGVALWQAGEITHEICARHGLTHSETLLPMAESALSAAGLAPKDVDLFACVAGPGSFTGVRIGVCTVRALSHATGAPCIALDALETLAAGVYAFNGLVCPILDARRGQVYGAAFRVSDGVPVRVSDDAALPLADFVAPLPENEPLLFLGDGALAMRDKLPKGRSKIAPAHLCYIRPAAAATLAYEKRDSADSCERLLPIYLRAPQAERERAERMAACPT